MPIAQIEYDRRLEHLNLFLERVRHGAFRTGRRYRSDDIDDSVITEFHDLEQMLNNIATAGDLGYADWTANTNFTKSAIVNIDGYLLICIVGGTTGASVPAIPANIGDTVVDLPASATYLVRRHDGFRWRHHPRATIPVCQRGEYLVRPVQD